MAKKDKNEEEDFNFKLPSTKGYGDVYAQGAVNMNAAKLTAENKAMDVGQFFQPIEEAVASRAADVKLAREDFEKNKPQDYNVELLEGAAKEKMTEFVTQMKDEYNVASKIATSYSSKTNSPEYKDAVAKMEKVKTALEKNYNGFKQYQEDRTNRIANSGTEVAMGTADGIHNDLVISPEGYNYITPTIDGPMFNAGGEGEESVSLGSIYKPDYMDGESATAITTNFLTNPDAFGKDLSKDPAIFARELSNLSFEIQKDKGLVRRIAFNGLTNDPDTRFIDYYIATESAEGRLPDVGIVDINDDQVIDKNDKVNGSFVFEKDDDSKFQAAIETLRNDKNLDLSKPVSEFLKKMGQDKFDYSRKIATENRPIKLSSYGEVTAKDVDGLFTGINNGEPLTDQNGRVWANDGDGWYTKIKDEKGQDAKSKPVSTAQMYSHLGLGKHAKDFGYDINGNKLNDDANNTTNNGSSNNNDQDNNQGNIDNSNASPDNTSEQNPNEVDDVEGGGGTVDNNGNIIPAGENDYTSVSTSVTNEQRQALLDGTLDNKIANATARDYIKGLVQNGGFDLFGMKGDLTPSDYQYITAHLSPQGDGFSVDKPMSKKELKAVREDFKNGDMYQSTLEADGKEAADALLTDDGTYYKVDKKVEPSEAFNTWKEKHDAKKPTVSKKTEVNVPTKKFVTEISANPPSKSRAKKLKENNIWAYSNLTSPSATYYGTFDRKQQIQLAEEVITHLLQVNTIEELESGPTEKKWYSTQDTPATKYKKMVELREKMVNGGDTQPGA